MHRSTSRILTTHTGSLPRPSDLVAMLNAKELGEPYDAKAFAARVERAISEVVQQQVDAGIDVIGDGEHSKFNWMALRAGAPHRPRGDRQSGALPRRHAGFHRVCGRL
jgi:methionine synthase II (cobalamin-independent)